MNCPHYHLTKLTGPLHPSGKDYQCLVCKVVLRVDMKPVEIKVFDTSKREIKE